MLATDVAQKISLEYPSVPISVILGDAKEHGWLLLPKQYHAEMAEKSDHVAELERDEGPIQGGLVLEELALDALVTGLLFNRYLEELVNEMICSPKLHGETKASKLFLFPCPPKCSGKPFCQVFQHLLTHGLISIGLYRYVAECNPRYFVDTLPKQAYILSEHDSIYVLAVKEPTSALCGPNCILPQAGSPSQ
jgi:hypothetical protein